MKGLKIQNWCHIVDNQVYLGGEMVYSNDEAYTLKDFAKSYFRHIKPGYPKFFKMDEISKLGFLAAETLLSKITLTEEEKESTAIILSNSCSTIVTDTKHQSSIEDYDSFFPSPAVFVYTLPNIMTGEISIRHKLKGENAFFIVEKFSPELIANHINSLFLTNKIKSAIGGWVNHSSNSYEAFLYLAANDGDAFHTPDDIERIYKLKHK